MTVASISEILKNVKSHIESTSMLVLQSWASRLRGSDEPLEGETGHLLAWLS